MAASDLINLSGLMDDAKWPWCTDRQLSSGKFSSKFNCLESA